jgi:hypothetical protein
MYFDQTLWHKQRHTVWGTIALLAHFGRTLEEVISSVYVLTPLAEFAHDTSISIDKLS